MLVKKRNGSVVDFDSQKIKAALDKAYASLSPSSPEQERNTVWMTVLDRLADAEVVYIEAIQDLVEEVLMSLNPRVAKGYILYRQARATNRNDSLVTASGNVLTAASLTDWVSVTGHPNHPRTYDVHALVKRAMNEMYNGIADKQVRNSLILSSTSMASSDPVYLWVAADLLLHEIRIEVMGPESAVCPETSYYTYFPEMLEIGIEAKRYSPKLLKLFDVKRLAEALVPERDHLLPYIGLQTLYDRYLTHVDGHRIETPQHMFMRIAMGMCFNEADPTSRAIEFYNALSLTDYMSSTPTLFNSATLHSQMSSCFVSTVDDNLEGIYNVFRDNALLSKFSGGIGNDWTNVRALGAYIQGTNGASQGVVPFLRVNNDTAVAVNQGGKRKGAICSYLETWHLDIESFLELRKNTGDERRRTPDMNTANWIPDLFMFRVVEKAEWTLFSPEETPDLHDLYGQAFKQRYEFYEAEAAAGRMRNFKVVDAQTLFRKMLTMLFETSHPWLTFKDAFNIRNPQRHAGVIHSSNLCTEIALNTRPSIYSEYGERLALGETAVCNLGSINLRNMVDANSPDKINHAKFKTTVRTAVRMLDNVIDATFYPTPEAKNANSLHRPVGLGQMGFQDALYVLGIPFDSEEAVNFSSYITEWMALYAYEASADLAAEKGSYTSFAGSDWSKGVLPQDTVAYLEKERGMDPGSLLGRLAIKSHAPAEDWERVRAKAKLGMRNSHTLAIAPTATIASIVGVFASIEPVYENYCAKSNMSGSFAQYNEHMIAALKNVPGLWTEEFATKLRGSDGSIQNFAEVPKHLRDLYKTAYEVSPFSVIDNGVARQTWIDQAQSLNVWIRGVSGKLLYNVYVHAWRAGLKSTYYLRGTSASRAEKSTGDGSDLRGVASTVEPEAAFCVPTRKDDGTMGCEACE